MSPQWGDPDHDWAGINDCVDIMYEMLGEHVIQAKEKFGELRCYVSQTIDDGGWVKWFVGTYGWEWIGIRKWLFGVSYRRNGRDKRMSLSMLGVEITRSSRKAIPKKVKEHMEATFVDTYRKAYARCTQKYPHLREFILAPADYPEYLNGIVPESDCDHPCWWKGGGKKTCGVCMKEEKHDTIH